MPKQDSKPLTPEQRIKELETQLREAQEKAALFEAVIDVMRKDYRITVKAFGQVVAQRRVGTCPHFCGRGG